LILRIAEKALIVTRSIFVRAALLLLTTLFISRVDVEAQRRTVTMSGIVRDASSGEPIAAASVIFDSLVVAATNEAGTYQTPELSIASESFTLVFRRIGYASSAQDVVVPDTGASLQVDVTLFPAPTNVERIVVQGERVAIANPGLVGFYERREQGFGRYLTGDEIARIGGMDLTNHLRRLRIRARPRDLRDPFARTEFSPCYVAFVDGIRLLDLTTINEWVPANSLGGIEVHRVDEVGVLPGEFLAPPPPGCQDTAGIIMFWSKVQREPSPFEFGVHFGGLHGGEASGTGRYIGASFITRVRSGDSPVRLQMNTNVRTGGVGDAWQVFANLTTRPFGRRSPLYGGMGTGVSKRDVMASDLDGESIAAHHSVLAGLSFDLGAFRPFVEAQLLDPLQTSRTAIGLMLRTRLLLGS